MNILWAAVLFCAVSVDITKAAENICANGELYQPHPTDCSKFIQCFNKKPIEFMCQTNFYWNHAKQMCDLAQNVDCMVFIDKIDLLSVSQNIVLD